MEIEEVDDAPALMAVSEAGAGIDRVLAEAAAEKAKGIAVKICTGKIGTKERARVLVGNDIAESVFGRVGVISDQTLIKADTVNAMGESKVQIRNRYGGRGFFDVRLFGGNHKRRNFKERRARRRISHTYGWDATKCYDITIAATV